MMGRIKATTIPIIVILVTALCLSGCAKNYDLTKAQECENVLWKVNPSWENQTEGLNGYYVYLTNDDSIALYITVDTYGVISSPAEEIANRRDSTINGSESSGPTGKDWFDERLVDRDVGGHTAQIYKTGYTFLERNSIFGDKVTTYSAFIEDGEFYVEIMSPDESLLYAVLDTVWFT